MAAISFSTPSRWAAVWTINTCPWCRDKSSRIAGRVWFLNCQTIFICRGIIRTSGHPSGNSGRLRNRYFKERFIDLLNDVIRLTSRKITMSAACLIRGETPSIIQTGREAISNSWAFRMTGDVFSQPDCQTILSSPNTGSSNDWPSWSASVVLPDPEFPVMWILTICCDYRGRCFVSILDRMGIPTFVKLPLWVRSHHLMLNLEGRLCGQTCRRPNLISGHSPPLIETVVQCHVS